MIRVTSLGLTRFSAWAFLCVPVLVWIAFTWFDMPVNGADLACMIHTRQLLTAAVLWLPCQALP